jgi:urocanate hydratase
MKNHLSIKNKVYKISNIGKLITGTKLGSVTVKENVEILIENGKIQKIADKISTSGDIPNLDAKRCMITPSFVDPHTHLFPPVDRANEFALRPVKSYQEIAKEGGGILSSVKAVREASLDNIVNSNIDHLSRFYLNGTTTVEIKSGYGLSTEEELKMLKAIKDLQNLLKDKLNIIPTFLGAHAVPPEYKGNTDKYVELICNEMLPEVAKENLAEFVDVFCEKGYFNVEQTEKIIKKAIDLGFKIKLHADEFVDSGAAELSAKYGACSADHLMAVSEKGIEALKKGNVVATILPGTTIFLGKKDFAPAREMIDKGCTVAIASDFNPGSSVFQSLPLMMNFAMNFTKMSLEESFLGVTRNAALAINRKNLGIIEEDCEADMILWDNKIKNLAQIPYFNVESSKYIKAIVKSGNVDYFENTLQEKKFTNYTSSDSSDEEKYLKIVTAISETCKFNEDNQICNIPELPPLNPNFDHAPKRGHSLDEKGKALAITNALKYFHKDLHSQLTPIFQNELEEYGHIYMFNFLPKVDLESVPIHLLPGKSDTAKSMMHMILNNLDPKVAQFPQELITYGGNGAVFSNWAQFHLTMRHLINMNDKECLPMYSGHPAGVFPKLDSNSPSAVICNGMVIPNYSDLKNFENMFALGVSMYGQMTAGSWMYIGPQGIVHGTTLTIAEAAAIQDPQNPSLEGKIYVTSGLGGMSGAQPKAMKILGGICIVSEINEKALNKRHSQGWLDEKYTNLDELIKRAKEAQKNKEAVSIGYLGNIVDLWEGLAEADIHISLGSDQTSLHNPFNGGYYPCGMTFEESQELMIKDKDLFKLKIEETLRRHVKAINKVVEKCRMFFWDYGNAFLLQAERANADIKKDGKLRYLSYVENIMGPQFFDFGFGPYRWVCTSKDRSDLIKTDKIAEDVIKEQLSKCNPEIKNQLESNLKWIMHAEENKMTVGSMARILYSDTVGRVELALRMNEAIRKGEIKGTIVIGRDHHDVSGTDSPYRETANIYDGSSFTADMAYHNVIGDAMRGASWVSIHNGGGVGWGEVINGGFGLVLDGSENADKRAKSMLFWDVTNGLVRRARAGNKNAYITINNLRKIYPEFKPFIPSTVKF